MDKVQDREKLSEDASSTQILSLLCKRPIVGQKQPWPVQRPNIHHLCPRSRHLFVTRETLQSPQKKNNDQRERKKYITYHNKMLNNKKTEKERKKREWEAE